MGLLLQVVLNFRMGKFAGSHKIYIILLFTTNCLADLEGLTTLLGRTVFTRTFYLGGMIYTVLQMLLAYQALTMPGVIQKIHED
jgi:hypothetical protein